MFAVAVIPAKPIELVIAMFTSPGNVAEAPLPGTPYVTTPPATGSAKRLVTSTPRDAENVVLAPAC